MSDVVYDTQRPYLACFVILRRGTTVAFVLREHTTWMNGYYGPPAGKVEENESYTAGAIREAKEEAGITIDPKDLVYAHTMHRHSGGDMDWVDIYFEVTKWEGEPMNAEPDKHSELVWLDMKNLPDTIVPPVLAALEAVERGEQYSEYGWDQ